MTRTDAVGSIGDGMVSNYASSAARRQAEGGKLHGDIKGLDTHKLGVSRNEDVISKEKLGKLPQV